MRTFTAALATVGLTLVAAPCFAQEFSNQKDLAVSVDRLFGFHFSHLDRDTPNTDFDASSFQLGWRGRTLTPFEVPRAAIDYFVIDHLSIGGAIGIGSYGGDADGSDFLFAPRVGYVWNLADWAAFWLRGGLTFHTQSQPNEHGFAFTADPTFVLSPAQHVGFLLGFSFDQDLVGKTDAGPGPDQNQHYRDFAIVQAGMLVWF
ncbi:MAG TPA: hypothetical protein VL137_10905 [Polyangiaceae bacterium]|jgi:hypothetical protein|nr:hypothetical protein [Polyangiaceae bacterium]